MALPPNSELVAVGWLKTVSGLQPDLVATTVPEPNDRFAEYGFVQVSAGIGGDPDNYTSMQGPVLQIDCWAYQAGSKKVPWGKAATLASHIKAAIEGKRHGTRVVTPAAFDDAFVHSVVTNRDMRRVPDDEAYARYSLDIRIYWTRVAKEAA